MQMKYKADASVTVFLTLLFGLILAVVTATFENVRFLTVDAYMRLAAESAAMSVFGDYNRELFQEYGLFGYGGYAGYGVTELSKAYDKALSANLQTEPGEQDAAFNNIARKSGEYTSLYRISVVGTDLGEIRNITEASLFYEQMEAYLKTKVVLDLGEKIKGTYHDMANTDSGKSIQKNLDKTSEYEHGVYEEAVEEGDSIGQETDNSQEERDAEKAEEASAPDHAGGNPLETFRELLRDGTLNLVCDAKRLSKENIHTAYSEQKQEGTVQANDSKKTGAADILKNLLAGNETVFANDALRASDRQMQLIRYVQHVFPNYMKSGKQHFCYGLEYLVSGSEQERDNLQGIINRLLLIRTVCNFAYVHSDAGLQAESLATATEIAGALGLPILVTAIQQTILLILSVEESCVDITALLDGKSVPVLKNKGNFQVTYPEICSVNKKMFRVKAEKYRDSGQVWRNGVLDYQQYLWLLLMMVPEKTLRLRTYDLIQDDLQMRYNATFSLEQCVSGIQYQINYRMPFLWSGFAVGDQTTGAVSKTHSAYYCYQS